MVEENKEGIVSPIQPEQKPLSPTAQRDAEIVPVVRKLLAKMAQREDLLMGSHESVTPEKASEYYRKVYMEDVVPLFLEANIKLNAIPFVFSVILQPFQLLNDVTTSSFEMNRDLADAHKYGLKDVDDMRVADLDKALKAIGVDKAVDSTQEK